MELMEQTQWSGVSVSNDIVSQTNRTTSSANWWGTTITSFQDTVTRTTTTTTEQQTRTGINTQVIAQIDEESQGDKLRSQALIPFMRFKNITFVAQGMKPVTRFILSLIKLMYHLLLHQTNGCSTASLGGKLVTDGNGEVSGLFKFQTLMFLVILGSQLVRDYSDLHLQIQTKMHQSQKLLKQPFHQLVF